MKKRQPELLALYNTVHYKLTDRETDFKKSDRLKRKFNRKIDKKRMKGRKKKLEDKVNEHLKVK